MRQPGDPHTLRNGRPSPCPMARSMSTEHGKSHFNSARFLQKKPQTGKKAPPASLSKSTSGITNIKNDRDGRMPSAETVVSPVAARQAGPFSVTLSASHKQPGGSFEPVFPQYSAVERHSRSHDLPVQPVQRERRKPAELRSIQHVPLSGRQRGSQSGRH